MSRQPMAPEQFASLLETFQSSAFRLEALPQYLVEEEEEEFRLFLEGQPLPPPKSPEACAWDAMIARHVAGGRQLQRAHVLPEHLTPYLRFEIEWLYAQSCMAGEDVRLVLSTAPREIRALATEDFWLVDDRDVVFLNYDQEGRFSGLALDQSEEAVTRCRAVRTALLEHSISLRDYLRQTRCL